jgi:hypothetical protein
MIAEPIFQGLGHDVLYASIHGRSRQTQLSRRRGVYPERDRLLGATSAGAGNAWLGRVIPASVKDGRRAITQSC